MRFYLIIGKNALYTFEKNGQELIARNIEGSMSYPISVNNICEDVQKYMECLANEANLGTIAKLEFDVLESADEIHNAHILAVIAEYVKSKYELMSTMADVMGKLARDKTLFIDKYGINYDGDSYKYIGGKVVRGDFDLLAYPIYGNELADLLG